VAANENGGRGVRGAELAHLEEVEPGVFGKRLLLMR
jgi:hypothetical protein